MSVCSALDHAPFRRENKVLRFLKRIYRCLPSPPSTNFRCRAFKVNPYELLPHDSLILDIGSKSARGVYAFGKPPADAKVICVDLFPGPGVDLVADAHDLNMVADASVDCVVCVSVLMYCHDPVRVVREFRRVLKPGGVMYLNNPFVFPYAPDPDDYFRISFQGLKRICQDFECLESGFNRGPASTTTHVLVHFLAMLFCFNSRTLYGINTDLFKWLMFWVKYLDVFLGKFQMAHVLHSGAYFIGRKPMTPPVDFRT